MLQDPDRELKLGLVEIAAPDRDAAAAAAWSRLEPGFDLKVLRAVDLPARDGWDAIAQIAYVTKTEDRRAAFAVARRKGGTWYVHLVDGKTAALDRRGAEATVAIRSFKAAGLDKESFAGRKAHPFDAERQKQLGEFIEEWRKKTFVPGVAIAVTQGGKIVYEKGFGVRLLGKNDPVTPETLFMIGSNTKSLTSLLMARLVDRKVFSWSTPVTLLLPSFALGDEKVTRSLTMKHTVCACTGLPRQDLEFIFEYAHATPEDRVASMKAMVPTTGFGETFQYSNTMVSTGGYVAAHALHPTLKLGPAYDKAMQDEVFGPLGMRATTLDFRRAAAANHAMPHARGFAPEYRPIPLEWEGGVTSVRPAGAAWSNVRDMSRYVLVELAKGVTPEGKRVVSEDNLLARRDPQVKISDEASYGLGLMVTTDHGLAIVQHGGNNLGFSSDMYFLPEHDIGVVVLTNGGGTNPYMAAVRRRLFEILFDGKPEAAENLASVLDVQKKARAEELALMKPAIDPDLLARILHDYTSNGLGPATVRREGKEVVFDVGEWKVPIAQKTDRDGRTKLVLMGRVFAGFELIPEEKDGRTTLTIQAPQQTYTFEPVAEAQNEIKKKK
ncbi:MAG TPA: serine hydrolase domain-containing protein [Haliangiales bacterium]|nr:serine hydrolase domain-containing protein [Haliangiales bacterium]